MKLLITRSDIAKYKQISKTPHDDKLNEQILDAQMLDIAPLLGERLYNKLLNKTDSYTDLLEGVTYVHDSENYQCYGLKMVICYYAYARYIMFSSVIDTPFSVVEKLNDNSRPVEAAAKKTIYNLNREAANQIWSNVSNYLTRTKNPDFNYCNKPAPLTGMKFTKIG
jgi:hypothetical protein